METIPKNPFEEYPFYHNSKKLENKDVLINIENLEKEKLDELLRQAETWAEFKDYKNSQPKKKNPFSRENFVKVSRPDINEKKTDINKEYNDYQSYLTLMEKMKPLVQPPLVQPPLAQPPLITRRSRITSPLVQPEAGQKIETADSIVFILSKMGDGSFGTVYKAIKINKKKENGENKTLEEITNEKTQIDRDTDERYCIIKIFKYKSNIIEEKFFNREDSVLRYLNQNPNQTVIVKYMGREQINNSFYIYFYKYTPGYITLSKYLINNMLSQTEEFYANIFYKLFLCIKHIHNSDIVHGDIKPDNIMISENANINDVNVLFLIDFGASCKLNKNRVMPDFDNIFCGSEYLSYTGHYADLRILKCLREQKNDNKCFINKNIIPGIDYFSLGIIMYSIFYQFYNKQEYSTLGQFITPFAVKYNDVPDVPDVPDVHVVHVPGTIQRLIDYYILYSIETDDLLRKFHLKNNLRVSDFDVFKKNVNNWKDGLQAFFTFIDNVMLDFYKKNQITHINQIPKMKELFRMYETKNQEVNVEQLNIIVENKIPNTGFLNKEEGKGKKSRRNQKKTKNLRKKTKNLRKK